MASSRLGAVGQYLGAHARVFAARRTENHHVRNVHRCLFIQNAAANILRRIGSRVLLHDIGVLDGDAALHRVDGKHASGLAFVAPGHNLHRVAMANQDGPRFLLRFTMTHGYQTSGASEIILANFFSRNSRATGPKTRVPTGSPASLISTAALSSKRMYVPSLRRRSLRMRTTTAFTTVPCLTWLSGVASFTAAVMTSPKPAFNPASPPSGKIHISFRAPELSATVSQVRIMIMVLLPCSDYSTDAFRVSTSFSRHRF